MSTSEKQDFSRSTDMLLVNKPPPSRTPLTTESGSTPSLPRPRAPSQSSMVLYHLASETPPLGSRTSSYSHSKASSISSLASAPRVFIPYEYDPTSDNQKPDDDEDALHNPDAPDPDLEKSAKKKSKSKSSRVPFSFNSRGFKNIGVLAVVVLGLISLVLIYPIVKFARDAKDKKNANNISGGIPSNPRLNRADHLVDPDTPDEVKSRTGFDGQKYQLVFSDEFNTPGRTFYPGDDPYFEAMDMWYGVTNDLEWYDPQQVVTRDGALVITMDYTETTQARVTPGSSAPFTLDDNHNLTFRSGMLQSWNKFCFTGGYVEVSVNLPGPDSEQKGYWPGAWTMGNLGRPGYRATTDGMWPYSYDECDVGTFPNQTEKGTTGPKLKDGIWPEYGSQLSVLNGQRLSACSCPNSDHPGPFGKLDNGDANPRYRGRGVPEIDIFEVQHGDAGGSVASQSAQFAPFTHDYQIDKLGLTIFNESITRPNGYQGSPLQQAVSTLTKVPDAGFQGVNGRRFVTYGFEYWADPNNRDDGFIIWQVDGKQSAKITPQAVGPDKGPEGSQVGQRIIPEEPLAMILNLGISNSWTNPVVESLVFPAEMSFDYVRIYQREGEVNVGCNPKDYPTADYILRHMDQYTNLNISGWEADKPRNGLYEGSC